MNSNELLDELSQYYQLALNENVLEVRKHLFAIISYLSERFLKEFNAEISGEVF